MENRDIKNSEAKLKAIKKYRDKTYDNLTVAIPKGTREYYKSEAKKLGYSSMNKFIIAAMDHEIKRGAN